MDATVKALRWMLVPASCLALTIVLYFFADRSVFAWGWMALGAAAVMSLAAKGLLHFPIVPLVRSRELRTQLALEMALFHWAVVEPSDRNRTDAISSLRVARRAARGTALKDKIKHIEDASASGNVLATQEVGQELRHVLKSMARNRSERLPLRRCTILPPECILPLSLGPSLAVVVLSGVAVNSILDGVLCWLVLSVLSYMAMRLAEVASWRVHDIVSQRTFRILMVSTAPRLNALGGLAVDLYSRIGHLVLVFVDDDVGLVWGTTGPGGYRICVPKAGLAAALDAFGCCADLVVLDSDDTGTAALVRSTVDLPASRYMALNANETVPPGYRWIEPMTLRISPSDRRAGMSDVEPYRLGVLPGQSFWRKWLAHGLLCVGVVLLAVEGGTPLALLCGVAAVSQAFPDWLGQRHRSAISPATLRVPRAPEFSGRLEPKQVGWWLTAGAVLAVLVASALIQPPVGFDWEGQPDYLTVMKGLAFFQLVLVLLVSLAGGALLSLKWFLDWNFRFLVLRRNSRRYGYAHKLVVMARCGKFGQVISLRDETFDQTDDDYGEWRESSLGSWFQIFSESANTLRPETFLHDWKRQFLLELDVTDFAVFDWVEEITDNMRWELECAGERLPGHRILIVHSPENQATVDDFLLSHAGLFRQRPHCLVYGRGPDDKFIWSNHAEFDRAFSDGLFGALAALTEEARPPHGKVGIGGWAYPRSTA